MLLPIAIEPFQEASYGTMAQISMDLYVDNIEAAYQYFQSHNVKFAIEWKTGQSMFVICDPDGLHWEIIG